MQGAYDLFYELFLSPEISSYFGPLAIVVIGAFVMQKNKVLGVLYFVMEWLIIAQYFDLVSATPAYWWHIYILLLGGLFTLVYPMWDR